MRLRNFLCTPLGEVDVLIPVSLNPTLSASGFLYLDSFHLLASLLEVPSIPIIVDFAYL